MIQIKTYILVFGPKRIESVLTKIRSVFQQINAIPVPVIIDNAVSKDYTACGQLVYAGDNHIMDFTGWQKGLSIVPANKDEIICFVNDTFDTNYGCNYLCNLTNEKFQLTYSTEKPFIVGYVDDFPRPAQLNGLNYSQWIRSNFFILNTNTLEKLAPLPFPLDFEEVFVNCEQFWSSTDLVSENFKAYISSWLFGEDSIRFPEYQLKWYKHQKLTQENFDFFRLKAMSILSEHYLGARITAHNIPIYNLNHMPPEKDRHIRDYYSQQNM